MQGMNCINDEASVVIGRMTPAKAVKDIVKAEAKYFTATVVDNGG